MLRHYHQERLYVLLDQAEHLAANFSGGHSGHFDSAQQFHHALAESIAKLKAGDQTQLDNLRLWFAPNWDNFIGKEGQDLANEIYGLLSLPNSAVQQDRGHRGCLLYTLLVIGIIIILLLLVVWLFHKFYRPFD